MFSIKFIYSILNPSILCIVIILVLCFKYISKKPNSWNWFARILPFIAWYNYIILLAGNFDPYFSTNSSMFEIFYMRIVTLLITIIIFFITLEWRMMYYYNKSIIKDLINKEKKPNK